MYPCSYYFVYVVLIIVTVCATHMEHHHQEDNPADRHWSGNARLREGVVVSRCSGFWPGCRLYDPTLLDLSTLDAPPTNHRSIATWCCCLVAQVKHSESVSSRSRPRSEISNQSIDLWGARGGEQTRRIPKRGGVVIAQFSLRVQGYMTLS